MTFPSDPPTAGAERLLIKADGASDLYQSITPVSAGWDLLSFAARRLRRGESWEHATGDHELALVVLGGRCSVHSSCGTFADLGSRRNVFDGLPWALYLPRRTQFTVTADSDAVDIAAGWCPADQDHPARAVTPDSVGVEIRGGGNATRQIVDVIPPGFDCQRLVAVEVYAPGGNWSSYPPHKHDEHRQDVAGDVVEADLEEIYFHKIDPPQGFAMQRVYTDDRRLDMALVVENNDVVLVPAGYHPVAVAPGYNGYYLNFLAGSAQSLANSDDPRHTWIKQSWPAPDPRLPLVKSPGDCSP